MRISPLSVTLALAAVAIAAYTGLVFAEDATFVGPVSQIQLAPDGKSATAVLKDNQSGKSVTITVTDDLTLAKFKDKRIVEGDEIRAKVEPKDGRNASKSFKKTAGC